MYLIPNSRASRSAFGYLLHLLLLPRIAHSFQCASLSAPSILTALLPVTIRPTATAARYASAAAYVTGERPARASQPNASRKQAAKRNRRSRPPSLSDNFGRGAVRTANKDERERASGAPSAGRRSEKESISFLSFERVRGEGEEGDWTRARVYGVENLPPLPYYYAQNGAAAAGAGEPDGRSERSEASREARPATLTRAHLHACSRMFAEARAKRRVWSNGGARIARRRIGICMADSMARGEAID